MRPTPRAVACIAILGIVIAVVVIQRRSAAPAAYDLDGTALPVGDTGIAQQVAPATAPASEHTAPASTGTGDEAARLCVQTIDDAKEFAARDQNPGDLQASAMSEDQLRAELEDLQRSLAGSSDSDFLTALLLDRPEARASSDSTAQTVLLDLGARAVESNSPLMAWHALRACVEAKQLCPFQHLEQRLLDVDRNNAEAWALVATLRYQRRDVAGALAAMQGAARATTSTWRWGETIALVERPLAEQTSIPFQDRVGMAFGAGAGALPVQGVLQMCRAQSAARRAWGEACLAFGTLRQEFNDTFAGQLIGYSIREVALKALGDTQAAADVAAEQAVSRAIGSELQIELELVATNPERFYAFLTAIREFGEGEGNRAFLRQELPPLLERAGLLNRDGARECVAQLFEPLAAAGTRAATAGHRIQAREEAAQRREESR